MNVMTLSTASGKPLPILRARDMVAAGTTINSDRHFWSPRALSGRLSELRIRPGTPWLTFLCRLILEAQTVDEPAIWVTVTEDTFYPPDFQANGVDLSRLPVVFAPDAPRACRTAEHLVRSGSFGLVILQIEDERLSNGSLGRLARLADKYSAAVLILTSTRVQDTLGSLISLRMECRIRETRRIRETSQDAQNGFACELVVTKDKLTKPGRVYAETCYGLPGLR